MKVFAANNEVIVLDEELTLLKQVMGTKAVPTVRIPLDKALQLKELLNQMDLGNGDIADLQAMVPTNTLVI